MRYDKSEKVLVGVTLSPDQMPCWHQSYHLCNTLSSYHLCNTLSLSMDNIVDGENASHIQLLGDEKDIFVLLVRKYAPPTLITTYTFNGKVIINASVKKPGVKWSSVRMLHAIIGCGSVSFGFWKEKMTAAKTLIKNDMKLETTGDQDVSDAKTLVPGQQFYARLNGAKDYKTMNALVQAVDCTVTLCSLSIFGFSSLVIH